MRWLWIVVVVPSVTMVAVGLALLVTTPGEHVPPGLHIEEMPGYLVLQISLTGVGGLLAARRPGSPLGWLLALAGGVSATQFLTAGYAVHGLWGGWPGATYSAWLYNWLGLLLALPLGFALLSFPDGRIRSIWSRSAALAIAIYSPLMAMTIALRPGPLGEIRQVRNPLAWDGHAGVLDATFLAGVLFAVVAVGSGLIHVLDRARHAVGTERQQMKWFVWSAVIIAVVAFPAMPFLFAEAAATAAGDGPRYLARVAVALASATLPGAVGIAILRYRLYDIDVLINRTLVYGALTATLGAAYVGSVLLLQTVLRPFTADNEIAVAVSTLAVVALFQPLRRRIQDVVDRRFFRSRYDAQRTLDAFADRLRDQIDLDDLKRELVAVVTDTVRPRLASVWLRETRREAS